MPSREVVVRPRDVEIVVAPELVADLYDPSLVISPNYVGPDRRRTDRWVPPNNGVPQWLRRVMQVVLLTTLVVVPLTMISARSLPPAASGSSSAQAQSSGKSGTKSPASPRLGAPHVITASNEQIARAEAAYHRALARVEASGAAVAPATSGSSAGSGAALTSERTEASQSAAPVASGKPAVTASTLAAQQHAASQAQTAQQRAAAAGAAAQRRAVRSAARAETQAQRTAAHSGADQGAPDGGTATGVQTAGS